ncbi:NADH:flavin oxidoreductase/NADH oxidase [Trichoderma barbatum]
MPHSSRIKPITFRCGLTIPNRLVKTSMSEELANEKHQPGGKQLLAVYQEWAQGGLGMVFTGNIHVDVAHIVSSRDIAISGSIPTAETLAIWKKWSEACCANGTKAIGIALSAMQLDLGTGMIPWLVNTIVFGTPREMTRWDIDDTIKKFADAAQLAFDAGFSERCNKRTDEYGGSSIARAKIVVDIIKAIRAVVPSSFCVGVKLNSADHQPHINNVEEILQQFEISGGTWENPVFNTGIDKAPTRASTLAREAFFIDFAATIRCKFPQVPFMVTGGFRSRDGMEAAIADGSCDLIGMARPSTLNAHLINVRDEN